MPTKRIIEIAHLSYDQIKSFNIAALKEAAKDMSLKGYSRFNKEALVNLVFDASNDERKKLINATRGDSDLQKNKKANPINVLNINQMLKDGHDAKTIAKWLFVDAMMQQYKVSSVATNLNVKLNKVIPETNLSAKEAKELKKEWDLILRRYNDKKTKKESSQKKADARKARDTKNTQQIVDWALDHLNSEKYSIRGLALAILSGRRMSEIYGKTTYEVEGKYLRVKGLAKKKADQENEALIIPFCDPQVWLKAWNSLPRRGLENKTINGTISKATSDQFPNTLKDLKIQKFKDCRDFYAAVCYHTFDELGVKPALFTRLVMGHTSMENTSYYQKYDCQPLTSMKKVFDNYTYLD